MPEKRKINPEYDAAWKKENTVIVAIRLNKRTDADILAQLENVESKAGELKKLIRAGMKAEKEKPVKKS